jgi:hypothetical protein
MKGFQYTFNMRLFQNFSFWNGFSGFNGKTGLLAGFSRGLSKINRVLEQAPMFHTKIPDGGMPPAAARQAGRKFRPAGRIR